MTELTLYADHDFQSPWVFHAMIALEEMKLPYELVPLALPIAAPRRDEFLRRAQLAKVPCVAHGDFWLTESSAISEYLHEQFPEAPRMLPSDVRERARARQVMSWLRTSLMPLREARPTSSVFGRKINVPLSDAARSDADELVRVTDQLLGQGRQSLFTTWSVADADLALALMRLVANGDDVPQRIVQYVEAQWQRPSIRKYIAQIPTSH